MASAIGMDKCRTKLVWQGLGLPVPEFAVLHDDSDFAAIERELGLPLFVKPAVEGSSVGVVKVKENRQPASRLSIGETSARRNLGRTLYRRRRIHLRRAKQRKALPSIHTLFRPPNFTITKPNTTATTPYINARPI